MKKQSEQYNLSSTFLRLRSDVSVEPLPVDSSFERKIASGELGTFHNEYLVALRSFDTDWSSWEVHPNGDEVACLLEGEVKFILEQENEHHAVELKESGAYVIVPKGAWHTAKTDVPSRMLFIASGEGTEHREAT